MLLYSGTTCPFSHRVRFALAEKGLEAQVVDIDMHDAPEVRARRNPYGDVPALVDRNLVLNEPGVICEYLDERHPQPALMPVDLAMRARARLMMFNFDRELFEHMRVFEAESGSKAKAAAGKSDPLRQEVGARLAHLGMMMAENAYVLGNDFTMVDVAIAPLLWRLDLYRILIPKTATTLKRYCDRIFERPGFVASMTPAERAMRR